jgi:RHS repeat-associated protein
MNSFVIKGSESLGLCLLAILATMPMFAALQTNVVERHYDRFGRPVGISLNGERRTEIAYDEATGRIASMRVAGEDDPFRWEYEPGTDLKKKLRYPNGATVEWSYEQHRDLVTLVSNDVYSSYRYEYDAVGRRVVKNDERYEYNVRGELVLATNVVTGTEFAYCYDDIGNRLRSREFGTNCTYVANELNQYTNIVRGGICELSAFDLDGNQTNVVTATGEWAVEYNGENRPVLWRRKSDGSTIRMAYDRFGRRVRKNDETFVYDGYLNISQTIWDPTEPITTRPLVWRGTGGNAFYFHDGNKNVVNVSFLARSDASHFAYSPYGEARTFSDGWLFSSEFYDGALTLPYYVYRHYNPQIGRWLTRDPAGEDFSVGLYSFCRDPLSESDSLGLNDSCDRVGNFNVLSINLSLTSQARAFNREEMRKDAARLLAELAKRGFSAVTSELGTVGDVLRLALSGGLYVKREADGRESGLGEDWLKREYETLFQRDVYRIDGVLRYQLCMCIGGKLRYEDQSDLTAHGDVDFSTIYDSALYYSVFDGVRREVEKDLLRQLNEKVGNAQK